MRSELSLNKQDFNRVTWKVLRGRDSVNQEMKSPPQKRISFIAIFFSNFMGMTHYNISQKGYN